MKKPVLHETTRVSKTACLIGDVTLGANVGIWYNAVLRADCAPITIGENSNVQDCCVLHVDVGVPLKLGKNVNVGHGAILHGCTVGDNTLIGMGSIILDNAVIGNNCLIAAGALVTGGSVIPDNSVVMGNPGKIRRETTEADSEGLTRLIKFYTDKLPEIE